MDILSKSTQALIQRPEVREAVHKLLDQGDKPGHGSVTVNTGGKAVELTREPDASDEAKG
jgi:hypothetical protein